MQSSIWSRGVLCLGLALSSIHQASAIEPRHISTKATLKTDSVIAVADFTGADKELGRFLSETLLTQLAQSGKLSLVERNEMKQALGEIKLQASGLFEPQQVKKLGKLISADSLIVGSYLVRDGQIVINARLLDVKSGKLIQGGSASVSGSRDDLLGVADKLARLIHQRLTGSPLVEPPAEPVKPVRAAELEQGPYGNSPFARFRSEGLLPSTSRPGDAVTEKDLARLGTLMQKRFQVYTDKPLAVAQPNAIVTRIRALTALLKIATPADKVETLRETDSELTPDSKDAPGWGVPYLALAISEGWWSSESAFRPRQTANWAFVTAMLDHISLEERHGSEIPAQGRNDSPEPVQVGFTGLLIDALDLTIERGMSPRIVDEDGQVVYPDPKHLPTDDFVVDKGIVSYYVSESDAKRCGRRPLTVRALDVSGSFKGDLVVSRETAEQIRRANRTSGLLNRFAVGVLIRTP